MGRDGCAGSKSIREAGGNVIVQDEPSSVVWGMPGAVVESNLANKVLPLNEIAPEIIRLCR
jgi:two-component system chemotaxis response regulator CheB